MRLPQGSPAEQHTMTGPGRDSSPTELRDISYLSDQLHCDHGSSGLQCTQPHSTRVGPSTMTRSGAASGGCLRKLSLPCQGSLPESKVVKHLSPTGSNLQCRRNCFPSSHLMRHPMAGSLHGMPRLAAQCRLPQVEPPSSDLPDGSVDTPNVAAGCQQQT